MKNIIFIEGVSGVGKSTTVKLLGEKLCDLGFSVACHLESDPDSPLDLCWTSYLTKSEYETLLITYPGLASKISENIVYQSNYILLRYQIGRTALYPPELHNKLHQREFCYNPTNTVPLSKSTEVFSNLWEQYANSDEMNLNYGIFDASLVSHMTSDLTRNYNASIDEMLKHLEVLLQPINHLNPIIFYLSSQDVSERLIKTRQSRNQTPATDEQIAFWKRRKKIDLSVLSKLSVNSYTIDVSGGNWDAVISKILSNISNN